MDLKDEIRRVAYELYERSGFIGGREVENWLAAEKIVMARHAELKQHAEAQPAKKATTTKTRKIAAKDAEAEPKKAKTASKKTTARKKVKPVK